VAANWRGDASGSTPPAAGAEWSARVEQTVEIAGQRGARMDEAERAVEVAVLRERFARLETRARAKALYVAALIAGANEASARRHEELGRRLYESARARVEAGAASDVEVRLAEVESGRLRHERVEAELGVAAAHAELRLALGLAPLAPLELA